MSSHQLDQQSVETLPSSHEGTDARYEVRERVTRLIQKSAFFLLFVTAACLPFSIKGAARSWRLAFLLWFLELALSRKRPKPQPLAAPLLAFVLLSGISSALSSEPYLSWDRMKVVCIVLVAILIAQSLRTLRQVRILTIAAVLSAVAASGFTAWQYTYGIGLKVDEVSPLAPLYRAGLVQNTVVTRVNGHSVHTPAQLFKLVQTLPDAAIVPVDFLREPLMKIRTYLSRRDFLTSGLGTPDLQFARARPLRAQGTLGHYVVFAEMLMQLGCVAWGLVLACKGTSTAGLVGSGVAFAAISAALMVTQTRAAMMGLAIGCFVSVLVLTSMRKRIVIAAVILVAAVPLTLYVQQTRKIDWTSSNDTGTQFRKLMWEDGVRLVREHPWFGVGMETVRVHWPEWNIRGFAIYHVQSHFHSTYLQIAVERGVPALLAWLWFLAAYFVFLLRLIRRLSNQNRFYAGISAGILAGTSGFAFTGLFHYNLGEEPLSIALYFFTGIALALDRLSKEDDLEPSPS